MISVVDGLAKRSLKTVIGRLLPFEEIIEAHRSLVSVELLPDGKSDIDQRHNLSTPAQY
jgi:hypothetical protein